MRGMAYRDAPPVQVEVLETFPVGIKKGAGLVGFLFAMAIVCGVAYAVTVFAGAPPGIENITWIFPVGMVVFAAPAIWINRGRRRELRVVRVRDVLKLVVPGAVELTFPLTLSGRTVVLRLNGVPMHYVYLKLIDRTGRALLLEEVRGALYGPVPDWFTAMDATPATAYDVRKLDDVKRLRTSIEAHNARAVLPEA